MSVDVCLRCGYEVIKDQCDCSSGRPLLDDNDPELRMMNKVLKDISEVDDELDTTERDADDQYDQWVDMQIEDKEQGNND